MKIISISHAGSGQKSCISGHEKEKKNFQMNAAYFSIFSATLGE
jgi:hypothetical protein